MRIWVVNNGSQWTHREWRVLRYLKQDTQIVENETPVEQLQEAGLDGLVLSGGAAQVAVDGRLGAVGDYLDRLDVPILGVCAGHQFMGLHFGGRLRAGGSPEFGQVEVEVLEPSGLFEGVPGRTVVWGNHNDEIEALPAGFVATARSDGCPVQAMRHESRPLFGVQFHPEVEHTQHGLTIFRNFVRICERARSA
jgi:GMP synthase (glutamine-hydrolysing)